MLSNKEKLQAQLVELEAVFAQMKTLRSNQITKQFLEYSINNLKTAILRCED